MCARLGFDMHIHQLRHYSATELIAAGVDVRTVAGRLGHGAGGATTLRVYSAWVAEADQRAAGNLAARLPMAPIDLAATAPRPSNAALPAAAQQDAPYQRIATDLHGAIACGAIGAGDPLPTVKEIQARYAVSAGTANRAVKLLIDAGLVMAGRGGRATVSG